MVELGSGSAREAADYQLSRFAFYLIAQNGDDIAETIVWLIEGAGMVTGETTFVDAGMHVPTPR